MIYPCVKHQSSSYKAMILVDVQLKKKVSHD